LMAGEESNPRAACSPVDQLLDPLLVRAGRREWLKPVNTTTEIIRRGKVRPGVGIVTSVHDGSLKSGSGSRWQAEVLPEAWRAGADKRARERIRRGVSFH